MKDTLRFIHIVLLAALIGCAQAIPDESPPAAQLPAQPGARVAGGAPATAGAPVAAADLADEIERSLNAELDLWFPRCIDHERGGFQQVYNHQWQPVADARRGAVFQSRMVWVTATMARHLPERREAFTAHAAHGLKYLQEHLADAEHGGLLWERMADGTPSPQFADEKGSYALAFVIYGAAAAHDVLPESGALKLAQDTFAWLEQHAHDKDHGGYIEGLRRDGTPILDPSQSQRPNARFDALGTPYGFKSMNAHLHLLEAFTELYLRWPDPLLKRRLAELHEIMLDRMYVEPGAMHLYYTRDWRPVPGHDSFGHDVEAGYLLLESAAALGMPEDPRTHTAARRLVDHALAIGWDRTHGGLFYEGQTFKKPDVTDKQWWAQAEMLNALLLMHARFGREDPRYGQRLVDQWRWIAERQIDPVHGGWHSATAADGTAAPNGYKGHHWKGCYHNSRAMLNVARGLRALPAELQMLPAPSPLPER